MWPDRVSNPGPLTYESGALPTALRGPAEVTVSWEQYMKGEAHPSPFTAFEKNAHLLLGLTEGVFQAHVDPTRDLMHYNRVTV